MTAIKKHIKAIKVHALCWSIYIAYEILVSAAMSNQFSHFLYYVLFYLLNISLFYVHACLLLPNSTHSTLTLLWRLPLFLVIELAAYIGLFMLIIILLHHLDLRSNPNLNFDLRFYMGVFWRGVSFIMYGTGYYFLVNYIKRKQRAMEKALEVEQLKLELVMIEKDLLRSQINPHLLFNTLNFIKFAAKKRPEQVDDAIIRLSEIMSFALEKSNSGFIALGKELRQVENMIRLNQLRFENKLYINYHVNVRDENIQIIPVVLLTLVENIFKHGDLFNPNFPATIEVTAQANEIIVKTANLTGYILHHGSAHTGLKNITSRLAFAYPGSHNFSYAFEDQVFRTALHIRLL